MKKFLAIVLALGMVVWAGNSMATVFTLDSYTVELNTSDPGLVLYAIDILSEPFSEDLSAGVSYDWSLFRIGSSEDYSNWFEDTDWLDISVAFNFSAPEIMNDTITGQTHGMWFRDRGEVQWDDPILFNFGNGGQFEVGLTDTDFRLPGSSIVHMQLDFISDSDSTAAAPVPEPATILLMGFGLLGLAGYSRKRFSKKGLNR